MFFRTPFSDRLNAPIVAENASIGIGSAGGMYSELGYPRGGGVRNFISASAVQSW
jgi:hypothetical protein